MTREEAIARIKDHIEIHRCHERNAVKIFEALDMAIKALEQPEPCEDTISRQEAIVAINAMFASTPTQMDMKADCLEIIENLPSAQTEKIIRCRDCKHRPEPCEDTISRQAAIALAKDICVPIKDGTVYKHRCIDPDAIKELPSAQPERKTGRWIDGKLDWHGIAMERYCSECGQLLTSAKTIKMSFCPNCGSDMREEQCGKT